VKTLHYSFIAALAAALVLTSPAHAAGRRPSDVPNGETVRVTRVIDGQTIEVSRAGGTATVRYLGITLDDCQATAATNANRALVLNKLVRLETDSAVNDINAAGQLQRFVYVLDGRMTSEEMISAGIARTETLNPAQKHQVGLTQLEANAARANRGGWAGCNWPKSAAVTGGCTIVSVERLLENVSPLPELASLQPGACVTVFKAANAASGEWTGQTRYFPAGSVVSKGIMYARWKDATLLITPDANGLLQGHVVRDTFRARLTPFDRGQFQNREPGATQVNLRAIEPDPSDATLLTLSNPRTQLFRVRADGQLETLTDVLVYVSGTYKAPRYTPLGVVE
jgi:endonuclease YncB( thermonuclease family)